VPIQNRVTGVPIVSFLFFSFQYFFSAKSLFDELCPCCSTDSVEDLQPSATDDGWCVVEPKAPDTEHGQVGADLVAPTMEQSPAVDPVGPTMEEPMAAGPMSPRGGAHDEGDLADVPSYEEAWTTMWMSANLAGAGT
jgi:hypothetical protein